MNTAKYLDEEKVIKRGIDALMRELGPVETVRFVNLPRKRRLESVKRHRKWQKSLVKDEFLADVFSE